VNSLERRVGEGRWGVNSRKAWEAWEEWEVLIRAGVARGWLGGMLQLGKIAVVVEHGSTESGPTTGVVFFGVFGAGSWGMMEARWMIIRK
jgi:hypothetical protein